MAQIYSEVYDVEIVDDQDHSPSASVTADRSLMWMMAALLGGSAGIHLAMVPAHAASSVREGVAFALAGWVQAALAVAMLLRPSRRVVVAALGLSVAVLGTWVVSRTVGLPVGEHAGVAEPVGALDGLCAGFEVLVVVGSLVALRPQRPWWARTSARTAAAAAVMVAALTTTVLVSPAGQHGHADASDGHGAHGHDCTEPVTPQQQAAADALVAQSRAVVASYTEFAKAQADGFVPITPPDAKLVHYAVPQRLSDGKVLEPEAVESLVYATGPGGAKYFLGAMYLQDGLNPATPTPGGCATSWHAHDNLCLSEQKGMVGVVGKDGTCPAGSTNKTTVMMLHVWSIDLPAGPFAELHEVKAAEIAAALRASGVPVN